MELVKEKEKQAERATARIHDGLKTQMELIGNEGSWTGGQTSRPVVKEKVVEKEKAEEPERETKEEAAPAATPPNAPSMDDDDEKKDDVAGMGILDLARGANLSKV